MQEADAALLNGTHGATVLTHLAGKPVMQFPIVLEQELNARATARLGAGRIGTMQPSPALAEELQEFLQNDSYANVARQFAAKYANHSPDEQREDAIRTLENLLK